LKSGQYWLSFDGNDKSIEIKEKSTVQINEGTGKISLGTSYSENSCYLTSYISFNAQHNNQGLCLFRSDASNNEGVAVTLDTVGNIRFISIASDSDNNKIIHETSMINNTTLFVTGDGKVGIRTATPQYELDVRGTGHFCTLKVKTQGWCDYVFDENYTLLPLEELEQYIKLHKKLPDIPSENDVNTNGIDVALMNKILTKKIEELTLYIIQLNNEIKSLKENQKTK